MGTGILEFWIMFLAILVVWLLRVAAAQDHLLMRTLSVASIICCS